MSEPGVLRESASEIEAKAMAWIERRHFGNWSADGEDALEAWLSQSLYHRVAFDRLDLGWQRTERLTALRSLQFVPGVQPSARRLRLRVLGALFPVVALAMAVAGWFLVSVDKPLAYSTSVGGREVVRLIDGSQIELNTDTVIRVADRTDRREVWLDRGEAYFQITHNAARPFTVVAGPQRITDIGTRFLLRRGDDDLKVAVSEGSVRVDSSDVSLREKAIVLNPGDMAVATASGVKVGKEEANKLASDLAWRSGVLVFHHTRLADAAAEFNRYNHKQIVIAGTSVANFEIGGTFPTTDVDGFAVVSRDVLKLHVQANGGNVLISR